MVQHLHPYMTTGKYRYTEYILWNVGLYEAQTGIKIAGRNVSNLRYTNDTTLMAESEEELKSILMKVKEESEKAGLKLNIQTTKIMASGSIISWQTNGETMVTVTDLFLGVQNHCRWWLCCKKGDPFQGPKVGSCLTLRNELSEKTHVVTK